MNDCTNIQKNAIPTEEDSLVVCNRAYLKFFKYLQANFKDLVKAQPSNILIGNVLSFHSDNNKYQMPRVSFNFSTKQNTSDWREIDSIPKIESQYPHAVNLKADQFSFGFCMDNFCNNDIVFERFNSYLEDLINFALVHHYIREHKNDPSSQFIEDRDLEKAVAEYNLIGFFVCRLYNENDFKSALRSKLGRIFVFYQSAVLNKDIILYLDKTTHINFNEYKYLIDTVSTENIDHIIGLVKQHRIADALTYQYLNIDNIESLLIEAQKSDIAFIKGNSNILRSFLNYVHKEYKGNLDKAKFILSVLIRNKSLYLDLLALRPLVEKIVSLKNNSEHIDKLSWIIQLYHNALGQNVDRKNVLINFIIGNNTLFSENKAPVVDLKHYDMIQKHWDATQLLTYANNYNRSLETQLGDMTEHFEISVEDNPYFGYKIEPQGLPINSSVLRVGIDLSLQLITSSKKMLNAANKVGVDLSRICFRLTERRDLIFLFEYRGQHGVCVANTKGLHDKFEILEIISTTGLEHQLDLRDSLLIFIHKLKNYNDPI